MTLKKKRKNFIHTEIRKPLQRVELNSLTFIQLMFVWGKNRLF